MDNELFQFSLDLMLKAGKIFKKGYYSPKNVKMKSKREMVTETDEAIEKLFYDSFEKNYPGIVFLGEESASNSPFGKGINAILNPVDGTSNFVYGIPFTAISLGIYKDGKGIFGMVYNPVLNEFFVGIEGKGSYLNNNPIRVSGTKKIENSLLATGLPYDRSKNSNLENIATVGLKCRDIRRLGSAALDICYTAQGIFDGYWELGLKAWDVAAGAIIVRNAGGNVTNMYSRELDLFQGSFLITNNKIHNKLNNLLKEAL